VEEPPAGEGARALTFVWGLQGVAVTGRGETAEADVVCIGAGETLREAGHVMRALGVGTLGVRGENGEFHGLISRDMVVGTIAAGGDPGTLTVGEVVPVTRHPAKPRSVLPVRLPMAMA
jgi:CBS domain-containing protein